MYAFDVGDIVISMQTAVGGADAVAVSTAVPNRQRIDRLLKAVC